MKATAILAFAIIFSLFITQASAWCWWSFDQCNQYCDKCEEYYNSYTKLSKWCCDDTTTGNFELSQFSESGENDWSDSSDYFYA
mmetsp:Transcript_4144/g.3516  ORF Transcript_4144/g.3516 Transcript_4144/m.3516 type:complete len:84 (-) Transcript_4144:177-428(-)